MARDTSPRLNAFCEVRGRLTKPRLNRKNRPAFDAKVCRQRVLLGVVGFAPCGKWVGVIHALELARSKQAVKAPCRRLAQLQRKVVYAQTISRHPLAIWFAICQLVVIKRTAKGTEK
jgi:hypothetical protein